MDGRLSHIPKLTNAKQYSGEIQRLQRGRYGIEIGKIDFRTIWCNPARNKTVPGLCFATRFIAARSVH